MNKYHSYILSGVQGGLSGFFSELGNISKLTDAPKVETVSSIGEWSLSKKSTVSTFFRYLALNICFSVITFYD
jgi:hypothetical protein